MNSNLSKYLFYYPSTLLKGERIFKYLSEYRHSQWFPPNLITENQFNNLSKLIHHAYNTSPYYKKLFDEQSFKPSNITSLNDLEMIPYLDKDTIQNSFDTLQSSNKYLFTSNKTTGGSTGQTLTISKNANALARERAITWRSYEWAGVSIGDPQARFWGTPIDNKENFKYKIVDFIANRYRISAFNLNEQRLQEYYNELVKYKPKYLYGYVSVLLEFSRFIHNYKLEPIDSLLCIITTSEILTEQNRSDLINTFNVPVFNEYGCGEVGSIAHECEYGNMHIASENLIVEIMRPADTDINTGEIVVTDLFNYKMPLIRYKLSDFGSLSSTPCPCGRSLPVLKKIHGRAYDFIEDSSGLKHHPELLMYIFENLKKKGFEIEQFQVVQTSINKLTIHLISTNNNNEALEKAITSSIHNHVNHNFRISFLYVSSIPREPSGKLRIIKRLHNL